MYFHNVVGTESYTTSTTNMYKDRFHVRVAVVGGRGCIACCRERQRHRGTRVNVFQLFLNAAFNGGGSTVAGSGGNNNGPKPTKQWWSKRRMVKKKEWSKRVKY